MREKFFKLSKRNGFTLVETMTSLMIFSLVILIAGMISHDIRFSGSRDLTTRFYSYLDVLENQHYRFKRCDNNQLTLVKGHKTYYVNFYPNMNRLVMSTDQGGYEVLLDKVKAVNWRYDHGGVSHNLTMTNGEHFSGKSRFDG